MCKNGFVHKWLYKNRDSSVGIVPHWGLDGLGIKSLWGWDFPHPPRMALVPTQPPVKWVLGFQEGASCWGMDHPLPCSAEVKERVELYLYSPSETFWPVLGWTLPLPYHFISLICWIFAKMSLRTFHFMSWMTLCPRCVLNGRGLGCLYKCFMIKLSSASSNCGAVITLYRSLLTSAKNMERVFCTGRS